MTSKAGRGGCRAAAPPADIEDEEGRAEGRGRGSEPCSSPARLEDLLLIAPTPRPGMPNLRRRKSLSAARKAAETPAPTKTDIPL